MSTINDLKNLNLKVGKITAVDDHPNAQNLYVLKVDIGSETRTLVAGLKKYYSKEELLGKLIVVVCNLEYKELRGVVSQGMLLAAQDGNIVSVLTVDKPVAAGSDIL